MEIPIFDAHCDVLYKMYLDPTISFADSSKLHVNLNYLKEHHKSIQCFAIYVPESVKFEDRYHVSLEMIQIFYEKILNVYEEIVLVRTREDIYNLEDGKIGVILTLEGCDAIGDDLVKLDTLLQLGISSVGLTWNYANLVADGALEERNAGLTEFGKQVVQRNNEKHVWTDVSHLGEKSFWDVVEVAEHIIASHSNCKSLFSHPRNLTDEQIIALIEKNGVIGITFVPQFLEERGEAYISHIIKHIDYICALGGQNNVGLGSDFDGIEHTVKDLSSYADYAHFINILLKHFSETQVRKICFDNFASRFPRAQAK